MPFTLRKFLIFKKTGFYNCCIDICPGKLFFMSLEDISFLLNKKQILFHCFVAFLISLKYFKALIAFKKKLNFS